MSVIETTTRTWVGRQATHGSTNPNENAFTESATVPAAEDRQRELLTRLMERSMDENGLDWRALLRVDDSWGVREA